MKKQISTKLKSRLSGLALALALAVTVCAPVYAASKKSSGYGRSHYVDYDTVIAHNGIVEYAVVYTGSDVNYTDEAYLTVTKTSLGYVGAATYDLLGQKISKDYYLGSDEGVLIENAANYPGQYIRIGFYRDDINGEYFVRGRFYNDGI